MEIILRQDIKKLGKAGDTVEVKDGYARNFLIPKGAACEATTANVAVIEAEKKRKLTQETKKVDDARKAAEGLKGVSCTVAVEAMKDDRLYGNITAVEIAQALEVEGVALDKDFIVIEPPIDKLGIYDVEVRLLPEVTAKVRVWVTRK